MSKHEEARNWVYEQTNGSRRDLRNYINEAETTEQKLSQCKVECGTYKMLYEQLQKDVERYFELKSYHGTLGDEWNDKKYQDLEKKLSKVGKE